MASSALRYSRLVSPGSSAYLVRTSTSFAVVMGTRICAANSCCTALLCARAAAFISFTCTMVSWLSLIVRLPFSPFLDPLGDVQRAPGVTVAAVEPALFGGADGAPFAARVLRGAAVVGAVDLVVG